ncbi:MAG: hypothetical protein C4547_06785 [Phycisphaerales bacterium]|nr:MAG: hypothetical protein C4547_06785 [Phycisphaerales bacterium]
MSALALAAALAGPAAAVDLTVAGIEINQAVQFGGTPLIGENVTMVRVTVGVANAPGDVPNVDALLRVFVDGEEVDGSPFRSVNGPITAPRAPRRDVLNHTVNFTVLPPVSEDVDFRVEVNPDRLVTETNYDNNGGAALDNVFLCRKTIDYAFVSTDYRPGGGQPPADLIEPGIGDGFLRAIYTVGEWNYHASPLPPLVWTQDINATATQFLNTLRDIRTVQIPNAGYPAPEFVYGWLPGNPYSGNGRAIGIPGDVAFGNSQTIRHQRTMAHETGHLWGLSHHSRTINTVGLDTEHHLHDTERLPQLFPPNKLDVMVAGQLTNAAFVESLTYTAAVNDARSQCGLAPLGRPGAEPALRISGSIHNLTRRVSLDPVMKFDPGVVDPSRPDGDIWIVGYDGQGNELFTIGYVTDSNLHPCGESDPSAPPVTYEFSPIHVLAPAAVNQTPVTRVEIVDRATGMVLASRQASPHPPIVAFVGAGNLALVNGRVRIEWTGADPDGDSLSYNLLYSPNQGSDWFPLVVNTGQTSFEFDPGDVVGSRGRQALLKLVATDGFNVQSAVSGPFELIAASPPATYLITPNDGSVHLIGAPIAFHAAAWDKEDLMLDGDSIAWTSDRDGPIGAGRIPLSAALSAGTHVITVRATDDDGDFSEDQITINVVPRPISISCENVKKLKGKCKDSGIATAVVKLKTDEFDGSEVTIRLDDRNFEVTIEGKAAKLTTCCFQGRIEIELIRPGGCVPTRNIDCP